MVHTNMQVYDDVKDILYTKEQIEQRCAELASQIDNDYKGKIPMFVGILKGCVPFMTLLYNNTKIYSTIEYVRASSYKGGTSTTGNVELDDENIDVSNRDVIIVEDIIDTGLTLEAVTKILMDKGAKSVAICTLLDKPAHRKANINVKYVGFSVEDQFLIGFGLDYNELYRNLPFICTIDPNKID
ncbi:MAG: hypoxanthine phosphoribosyltransferase [Bacilli bacterium]|nr:hypoxanthine phosphoribosyltransferase [Bacilli bacterium]